MAVTGLLVLRGRIGYTLRVFILINMIIKKRRHFVIDPHGQSLTEVKRVISLRSTATTVRLHVMSLSYVHQTVNEY